MTASFSVVIPTFRRPERIARCLAALDAQRDAGPLEVVVVEDGGPTRELEALRNARFSSIDVRWLAQEHSGPAAARNLGARHASGSRLAFTDDDCRPRSNWVSTLGMALAGSPATIVGGHTVNAIEGNPFSEASQALVSFFTEHGEGRTPFFASNNLSMTRETFERVGAFDETFHLAGGEDRDFCDRAAALGIEFQHVPEAAVDHDHDLSLTAFLKQHFQYGRGAYLFRRARNRRDGTARDRSFRLGFYRALVTYPHRVERHPRRYTTSFLLALAQIPNALGYFVEAARNPSRSRPRERHRES